MCRHSPPAPPCQFSALLLLALCRRCCLTSRQLRGCPFLSSPSFVLLFALNDVNVLRRIPKAVRFENEPLGVIRDSVTFVFLVPHFMVSMLCHESLHVLDKLT